MKNGCNKLKWVGLVLMFGAGVCVADGMKNGKSICFGIQPPLVAAWTAQDKSKALEKTEQLYQQLTNAVVSGATGFVIPAGNYLINKPFLLSGVDGFHIDGSGSTFWTVGASWLKFVNCKNCTVENLIIDRLEYPFVQAVVSEIIPNGGTSQIIMDVEPGSVEPNTRYVYGRTLCKSALTGKYYYRPRGYEPDLKGKLREGKWIWTRHNSSTDPREPQMQVGDRIAMHASSPGHAGLEVVNCGGMNFVDISVYSAPGFMVMEKGVRSPGNNKYTRLKIIPRPGSTRVGTSTKDGFHSYNQKIGPTLIDCEIAGTCDDGINIHGFMNVIVQKVSDTEYILASEFGRDYEVGTEIDFYKKPTMKSLAAARVVGFENVDFSVGDPLLASAVNFFKENYKLRLRRTGEGLEFFKVTFDRPVAANEYDLAVSKEFCGRGAHIKNLYMHSGCNRGVLIKAPEARVENCRFENIFFGALYVTGEVGPIEGDFADNVVIQNNYFDSCGYYSLRNPENLWSSVSPITVLASVAPKSEMAYLHIVPERFFSGLVIRGNVINNSPGIAMFIANAEHALIENNIIINPLQEKWLYSQLNLSRRNRLEKTYAPPLSEEDLDRLTQSLYGIYIIASEQVTLRGNHVLGLPSAAKGAVGIGPWTSGIYEDQ